MVKLFYDFETNGINPLECAALQLAIMNEDEEIIFNEYIYPYDGVIDAVEIHGIDENKLREKNARQYQVVFRELVEKINNMYMNEEKIEWIAYNNFGYDQIVMEAHLKRLDMRVPIHWYFVDFYPLIKEMLPNLKPNYKLKTVYEYFEGNQQNIQYHCALADSTCLVKIMRYIQSLGYEHLINKYTRMGLVHREIMNDSISNIPGYQYFVEYGRMGINKIGDIYEEYEKNQYDEKKTSDWVRRVLRQKSSNYNHFMVNHLKIIKYFQENKRRRREV